MSIDPNKIDDEQFILTEEIYQPMYLGKYESIMCQGNGYLGLRNTFEEEEIKQTRGLFIAGTFNLFDSAEVPELPNAPDVVGMNIKLDGEQLSLSAMERLEYRRTLNMKTGMSQREITLRLKNGKRVALLFNRFVSMQEKHLIGQQITVTALDREVTVEIESGINGRVTNSGVQHFSEGTRRFYDGKIMQSEFTTTQSQIGFIYHTVHQSSESDLKPQIFMERRKMWCSYQLIVAPERPFRLEKCSTIHTSRDLDQAGRSWEEIKASSLAQIRDIEQSGFSQLFEASADAWQQHVWTPCVVKIDSTDKFDQLAMHFAIYHLAVMTPAHDSRMGIAAKGLSGEGYKGHAFWDTEIFCLPYFIYTQPEIARKLLEFRFNSLPGARQKARDHHYRGAQFPWEAAWIDDGEVTPVWGAADIVTGEAIKIWSGFLEYHISGDIAYAVSQYQELTKDINFMKQYGYQIVIETAEFWASRLEYNQDQRRYEINDVMGPDEYKEHVNNNAFTNYIAHFNMELALKYIAYLRDHDHETYQRLDKELGLERIYHEVETKISKLYLPQPNHEGLIPQDDTYLTLKDIDLTPYKNQKTLGKIFQSYNLEQINEIQVTKQADILLLLHLLEDRFERQVIEKNYLYYERRTLHDSTLSLSTHCQLAKKMNQMSRAYDLFRRACEIDLGSDMKSSDAGIHAASIGGIWQCVVLGFGGVKQINGGIQIEPSLPVHWKSLEFSLVIAEKTFRIRITKTEIIIIPIKKDGHASFFYQGQTYQVGQSELVIKRSIHNQ